MALLGVAAATPLLSVERIACTYNDVPMEMRQCFYVTNTHYYRNELH
jgi:GntR family transcriptional regulator